MIGVLRYIGKNTLSMLDSLGQAHAFLIAIFLGFKYVFHRPYILLQQVFELGVRSLANVLVAGMLVGMVLCLQGHYFLVNYGVDGSLGVIVASTLSRELGPVITALLFAGRVGSSLAAELALMKTTEQFDALEMMAVEPLQHIVAPRILAGLISLPVLSVIFVAMGVVGSYVAAVSFLHVDGAAFWLSMQGQVDFFRDILTGVAKSIVFALIVGWISLYQGYFARSGAFAMAKATTRSVVLSSLVVLAFDFLLTAFLYVEH